jgi:hypothetical protein
MTNVTATFKRFIYSFLREGNINPPGEQVCSIPHRLSVAHEDEQ